MGTFVLLAGCGDDSTGGGAGEGGGPSGGGGSSGVDSGGNGGSGSGGDPASGGSNVGGSGGTGAGGSPPELRRTGLVLAESISFSVSGTSVVQSGANALFFTQEAANCEPQVLGNCTFLSVCEGGDLVAVSAGDITITGGQRDFTLVPNAENQYTPDFASETLFGGGDALTFSLAGSAEVPAHSEVIAAPGLIDIDAPSLAALSVIDRSSDLAFSWSGTDQGTVLVRVIDVTSKLSASCSFDASANAGSVPSEVLQLLPPSNKAIVQVVTTELVDVGVGEFTVTIGASSPARDNAGASYLATNLTLE
jgi:hypothetical protein